MKATMTAALLLIASLAHAACPEIPASQRVRIVECRSGYAVQELVTPRFCSDGWSPIYDCGADLNVARWAKADRIAALEADDAERCAPPNLPLEPVRVVE
jgi:hypothetical protein